jgi:hypothetical protein
MHFLSPSTALHVPLISTILVESPNILDEDYKLRSFLSCDCLKFPVILFLTGPELKRISICGNKSE